MEEIFSLLTQQRTQEATNRILQRLSEQNNNEFIENFIHSLNRLTNEYITVSKAIYPSVLKLIGIENDMLRYSLVLSLKILVEQDPSLIIPYSKEYLTSPNANSREGMLQLLSFAANAHPNEIKPLLDMVVGLLADPMDFVQNKAMEFLNTLGKHCKLEVEEKILEFLKSTSDEKTHQNAEKVLKEIVNIKDLESEAMDKKHLEIQKKVLDKKEQDITQEEVKLKQEEIKKREEEVAHQKERKEQEEIYTQKKKELEKKEEALRERELELKIARILVEEKEKDVQEEIIKQKADILEQELEINRKRAELQKAEKEIELKILEEKKRTMVHNEDKRTEKRLNIINKDLEDDKEEEYEKIETNSN